MRHIILNYVFDDGEEIIDYWPADHPVFSIFDCEAELTGKAHLGLVAIEIVGTC